MLLKPFTPQIIAAEDFLNKALRISIFVLRSSIFKGLHNESDYSGKNGIFERTNTVKPNDPKAE
jgi:hypothetical protein